MRPRLAWLLAALVGACTSSGAPPEPAAKSPPAGPPAAPVSAPRDPEAPPPAPEPPPARFVVDPSGRGPACEDDAGCGWDDGCVPSRCVDRAHAAAEPAACDESAPAPGACTCHAGRCALRPSAPPAPSEPGCKARLCGLDESAGRCVVGEMLDANRRGRDSGPACRCDDASDRCEFEWLDPIPCDDVGACWISDDAPRRPIARPKRLRGRTFKPCRDGEVAPACREGRCTLVAYKC